MRLTGRVPTDRAQDDVSAAAVARDAMQAREHMGALTPETDQTRLLLIFPEGGSLIRGAQFSVDV